MRAIILSAGQGRRLLPLTRTRPKCLLPVAGERSVLDFQLDTLEACGVRDAVVMVGFGAEAVERRIAARRGPLRARARRNDEFARSDNLVTCYLALPEMQEDFLLLNGDTLFEPLVLRRLLSAPTAPARVAIDHKPSYDADDMKVSVGRSGRLRAVGKQLPASRTHGEAIGLIAFSGEGVARFRSAITQAVANPDASRLWYLSAVDDMAAQTPVETTSIRGLWWSEIDTPGDLRTVRQQLAAADQPRERRAATPRSNTSLPDPA